MGRTEVSLPWGACWVERICPSLLSLSSKEVYVVNSTHFPAGEMEASVMEGRECGWPEGPESFLTL